MRVAPSRSQLTRLENKNLALRKELAVLQGAIESRADRVENSLGALVGSAFPQSELASFDQLAYNNIYAPLTLNWTLLTYMYKTHGVLQAAIDMPVQDAFRGGVEVQSAELDKDDLKTMTDFLERESILTTFKQAEIWTRLYGGGGLIINAGGAPETPLNMKDLRNLKIYAANRWELVAPQRQAEYYTFYGVRVHRSRVMTMISKEAPYILRWTLQNWGMSELERLVEPFNIFLRTQNAIYDLLKEAKIDVFQFEGLASQLATNAGTQRTLNRITLMNRAKNNGNAILLDMKDKFEQKQMTFAGLAEIWKENRINLASTMRIPMTKLFGLSASGFSSGEDDIENYNAMVESEIREHVKPAVRQLLEIVMAHLFGDSFDFSFNFKPLRVLGAVEEEGVKTQKYNRYKSMYDCGQLTDQEFAEVCQKEGLIPIETDVARGAEPQPAREQPGQFQEDPDAGGDPNVEEAPEQDV